MKYHPLCGRIFIRCRETRLVYLSIPAGLLLFAAYEQFGVEVRSERRAAREVIALEAVRREDAAGDIAARAAAAVDVDWHGLVKIVDILPQFVKRDIRRAGEVPRIVLAAGAHVEHYYIVAVAYLGQIFGVELLDQPAEHVLRDVPRDVDGVFRGRERGSVGEFERGQVGNAHPRAERHGEHVYAFVDAASSHYLRAEQFARVGCEQQFYEHLLRAGIICRVGGGERDRFEVSYAVLCRRLFRQSRRSRRQSEQPYYARSLRAAVDVEPPADIVRRYAPLSVRGTRERYVHGLARDELLRLHRVARGENVGVGRVHKFVGDYRAAYARFQPAREREIAFGRDARRYERDVAGELPAVGDDGHAAFTFAELGRVHAELYVDAARRERLGD